MDLVPSGQAKCVWGKGVLQGVLHWSSNAYLRHDLAGVCLHNPAWYACKAADFLMLCPRCLKYNGNADASAGGAWGLQQLAATLAGLGSTEELGRQVY